MISMFTKRTLRSLLLPAVLTAGLAAAQAASAQNLPVYGDTTLSGDYPNTNFGTTANLVVNGTNNTAISFSLGTLPAGTTSTQISKATLTFYVNRYNPPANGQVPGISVLALASGSAFNELGVTYNNPPNYSAYQAVGLGIGGAGRFYSVDVTAGVQAMVANSFAYAQFILEPQNGSPLDIRLDSKENDATAHAPTLNITLVNQGPAGVNGMPGTNGTQGPPGQNGANGANGANGTNGNTPYSANILFPATTGSSKGGSALFGPVSGFGNAVMPTAQAIVELQAPSACTASGFSVNTQQPAAGAGSEFVLYRNVAGQLYSVIGCTLPQNGTSCTSPNSGSINAGDLLFIYTDNLGPELANTHAFVSFVCQ